MMLTEARDGMPTLDELAHILHITSRTLDRRLQREGQQFQEMTKRVRLERAFELLGTQRMSVTQVALQLGRSEEHTSELQSLMRITYAVSCLNKKISNKYKHTIRLNNTSRE